MDLLNEVPITLVIKAPNQKVADQTVECALNWTVKKLKEHLALVYPSNPTENQQKIIYSGKLLQDDVTLKDVLHKHGSTETLHTVHLVCSNSSTDVTASQNTSSSTQTSNVNPVSPTSDGLRNRRPISSELRQRSPDSHSQQPQQQPQQQPSVQSQTPHAGSPSVTANDGSERLQFPASAFYPTHYNAFLSSYLPSNAYDGIAQPSGHSYTAEQLRWLQQQHQAYAQYMSNYMQLFQQGAVGAAQPFNYAIPPLTVPLVPPNAAVDQPAIAVGEPVQQQQPQVVRMNAQGGLVNDDDDDDEMDRDWLDWFYVGVRFALLMCILFFYSTPIRFITTFILMLFIYCFQIGWFRFIGQRRQPVQPPANPPDGNAPDNPDSNRPVEPGSSGNEEPRQPRGLSLAWSVFLSFFASLAPQPPPPVNAN